MDTETMAKLWMLKIMVIVNAEKVTVPTAGLSLIELENR